MSVDVPQTQWRSPNGLVDYSTGDPNNIVDSSGVFLVDPSGTFIVDTGVTANLIPSTIWEEDDSI